MKKFIINYGREFTSIVQVEVVKLTMLEAFQLNHHMIYEKGNWMGKIIEPKSLYEKDKKSNLVPPVWCWWAFYDSLEECQAQAKESLKLSMERNKVKANIEPSTITDQELEEAFNSIKIELLP